MTEVANEAAVAPDISEPSINEHSLKIHFYTHGLVQGGAERVLAVLASSFRDAGHDVTFVVDFEADENRSYLSDDVPMVVLGGGHIKSVFMLARHLRRSELDVVLSAVGGSNVKVVLAKLLALSRVPLVIGYHGFEEWKSGFLARLSYLLLPLLSRVADATVVVADELKTVLVNKHGAKADRVTRIYNPVIVSSSGDARAALPDGVEPGFILAAGRLVDEKNYNLLIKALALDPLADARLVFLGGGPQRQELEQLAAELGVTARVTFAGFQREPWPWFEQAGVLALPSRTESFGNVVVEALGFGVPVVASQVTGPREIFTFDGVEHVGDASQCARGTALGSLVPVGQVPQLADELAHWLDANQGDNEQPGEVASRREETRRAHASLFDVDTAQKKYATLIKLLLSKRRIKHAAR